ncbi:SRPBCC family protein [Streptomyces sp. NBC_00316]|uniref:SRPBCC family protein n=1 Tax=Streptomyces sp. NBC_00316 TaxID=2975710 RepID=UPI002E2CED98|nr:SRPBCC family protein [Streptomyces sp. NBC_00316]
MAIRHRLIDHPPRALWAALEEETLYGEWVVGTSGSRSERGRWPQMGSSITYTVRVGPKEFQGRTTVRRIDRPHALELEADSGPLGTARIAFDIRPWGDGKTLVILDEHPLQGLGGMLHNTVLDAVLQVRHRTMLARLAQVIDDVSAEGDTGPPFTAEPPE